MPQRDDLGGHWNYTNIDRFPFDYLVGAFNPKSMLDVGCGPMGMVALALEYGLDAYGIDGDIDILYGDFTTGPRSRFSLCDFTVDYWKSPASFDLIWSVEVAEHIEERYCGNYLKTIAENLNLNGVLFFSHALPGQKGHHHVNCQPPSYWIERFAAFNIHHLAPESEHARRLSSNPYISNTGMVFRKGAR